MQLCITQTLGSRAIKQKKVGGLIKSPHLKQIEKYDVDSYKTQVVNPAPLKSIESDRIESVFNQIELNLFPDFISHKVFSKSFCRS